MTLRKEDIRKQVQRLHYAVGANEFFDEPTVRFAAATDPWFARFHEIIGPFHWTPQEALAQSAPQATARTVICWCLPKSRAARESNRLERQHPSLDWARARSFGEAASVAMREQLCRYLEEMGYAAAAPHCQMSYPEAIKRLAGNWSERHVAFVAGMGTFGLSAGLITERGIAHRLASVVSDLVLSPDPRPYGDDPFAWCSKCGSCAQRCPAQAIGKDFKDRDKGKCLRYAVEHITPERLQRYGWMDLSLGCGLCQTDVPCEFQRPPLARTKT
jgi:epoxyqueuosine reductase